MKSIIVIKKTADPVLFESIVGSENITKYGGLTRHFKLSLPVDMIPESAIPLIDQIEPVHVCATPCDPQPITVSDDMTGGNWGLLRVIRRRPPWSTSKIETPIESFFECVRDGSGVDIYILDTGIRTSHDEFGSRASILYEYSPAGSGGDDNGHGTSIASCAAGSTVGLARGSNVLSCKISSSPDGSAYNDGLIAGIGAMLSNYNSGSNPAICNVSYAFSSSSVESAIDDAVDAGIIFAGAAGNEGLDLDSTDAFPGEASDCVCVGAVGVLDIPTYFARDNGTISKTSYGISAVDIMAPGQFFWLADKDADDDYIRLAASTSAATGLTTGVLACMLQGHSKLTSRSDVQAVKAKLLANSTTGRLSIPANWHTPSGSLPDRILYLDPYQSAPEPIPGL